MTRTPRRLAAAAGLAVLLLTGCGDSAAQPGAAAVVGDERITTDELAGVVDRALADPTANQQFGGNRADFQRQVLDRMVRVRLLEEAAAAEGVEVTQGDVDAQLNDFAEQAGGREQLEAQAAAGGISAQDLPDFVREITLEIRLADELTRDVDVPADQLQAVYDRNVGQFERVRSRHILVQDEAAAREILAAVQADPDRFAELAASRSTDTSNAEDGGELGWQGRGTFVPAFDEAVFTRPVGEPFVVQTEFGWHVVEVQDREVTSFADARPELRRSLLGEERSAAVEQALRETAERVGVEVNPRFGRWDPETAQIVPVPADDGLSSPGSGEGDGEGNGESGTGEPGTGGGTGGGTGDSTDGGTQPAEEEPVPSPTS